MNKKSEVTKQKSLRNYQSVTVTGHLKYKPAKTTVNMAPRHLLPPLVGYLSRIDLHGSGPLCNASCSLRRASVGPGKANTNLVGGDGLNPIGRGTYVYAILCYSSGSRVGMTIYSQTFTTFTKPERSAVASLPCTDLGWFKLLLVCFIMLHPAALSVFSDSLDSYMCVIVRLCVLPVSIPLPLLLDKIFGSLC